LPPVLPPVRPAPRHLRGVHQHEGPDPESPRAVGHWRVGTARRLRDRDSRHPRGARLVRGVPGLGPHPRGGGAAVRPVPGPLAVLPPPGHAPHPSAPARLRRLGRALRDCDQPAARRPARRRPRREGPSWEPPALLVVVRAADPVLTEPTLSRVMPLWLPHLHPLGATSASAHRLAAPGPAA